MTHNYPYKPIENSQFRILQLQPAASADEPLRAKLEICERQPTVNYEALSYVWGSDGGQHEDLNILSDEIIGNLSFRIRPNLVSALKRSYFAHVS